MKEDKTELIQNTVAAWVREYGDDLYKRAFFKTSDKVTAEDLVQDTFLAALRSYESFKGESNPKTWLFSILNNKIVDHYRKQARSLMTFESNSEEKVFRETEEMFDAYDNWGPGTVWNEETDFLVDPDFEKIMDKCMDDLPENWKTILLSKYLLGKEGKEICKELSITASNYWQILHRSKLLLKKCIEINWFDVKL
jgi:RNA polymerase sigma-70 factor (TIGR02943 family)